MNDTCTYLIQLREQVNESEINTASPIQVTVVRLDAAATLLSISTDQSGLIGMIRHLHNRGFVLLSIQREE